MYLQTWHGTPLKKLGFDIEVDGPENLQEKTFI
ncbi:CDP-glycerol glycerophosphotransferase family protein [Bacillus inaquosorum]|nr:CDP-glycerol glycerophosphotransferase family protein [Bacillus inaquosorum]